MNNILVTRSSMPSFEEYCEEIKDIWDSHWLTNMGVKHKELQKELENAETPENIEAQARQQLRLIKPGEVLYMFPSEITDRDDSSTGGQKGDSSR